MVDLLHKDLPPPHETRGLIDALLGKELLAFPHLLLILQYYSTSSGTPVPSESMVQLGGIVWTGDRAL